MQVDETDSLALFVLSIPVLNSCAHGIVPCVSSQSSDMGFCTGRFQQQRVLQLILLASLLIFLGFFCAGKRRKAALAGHTEKFFGLMLWTQM